MERFSDSSHGFIVFIFGFIICGAVHVMLADVHYARCAAQIMFGGLTLFWALNVYRCVTDRRIRRILMLISRLLVLYFMFQIGKYMLFRGLPALQRYAWYGYYIPMVLIPLLVFYVALCLYRPEEEPLELKWRLLQIPAVVMILVTLTNDLHFWVFKFPTGEMVDGAHTRSWFYWVFFSWCVLMALGSFIVLSKKFTRKRFRVVRWFPLLFELFGFLLILLYMLELLPSFNGVNMWNIGELFGFIILGFLDVCTKVGMIPANVGYDWIFARSDIPAVISDSDGSPVYRSRDVDGPLKADENTQIMTHPIAGGTVSWAVDVSEIRELRRKIDETTYTIRHRNEFLINENRLKQEQYELEMRNRVYDRITSIVKPQLDVIDDILRDEDADFDSNLTKVAVLNAYIKRRSNMELINLPGEGGDGNRAGMIPFRELTTAISESAEYIKLSGADAVVTFSGEGDLPAGMVKSAYEFFEYIVETCLDTLSDLAVVIRLADGNLSIRMLFQAYGFTYDQNDAYGDLTPWNGRVQITKERNDVVVSLTMEEGVRAS